VVEERSGGSVFWSQLARLGGSALTGALIVGVALIWAVPLIWAVGVALRPVSRPIGAGWLWLPGAPTLANFKDAWTYAPFLTYYINTIIIVGGILACQLVSIVLAGYAFARVRFPGRELFFLLFLFQLLTPVTVLVVPNYITMRDLHIINTKLAIMLPYLASGFGTFLVRQACRAVPIELEESARLQGASWWQVIWYVYLPLIRPSLIAFSIVSITFHWNDFLWPLIITNTPDARPLTVGLASFAQAGETGAIFPLIMAGTLLVAAPLLVGFFALQRQFIESFLHSGVK
jgi:sn-glycerol 3-phosphate transport system permease protein